MKIKSAQHSLAKIHSIFVGCLLVFIGLFINMAEAVLVQSLRYLFTMVFAYFLASSFLMNKVVLTKASLKYILFLIGFTLCFYLFGSANNLIIHLLTICFGTVLLYNALLASNFKPEKIWGFAIKVWCVIYLTLIIELILVTLEYQPTLFVIFPDETRALGLPAYRSLTNTFADFFDLNFSGLNSVTLQAQAFGQFCIMLTIFGFTYTRDKYNKSKISNTLVFLVAPLLLYSVSPNITASIIFIFILANFLFIKLYLRIYSFGKFLALFCFIIAIILYYYLGDFGFVRTYSFELLYTLFFEKQIDFIMTRSMFDLFLGVDVAEYNFYSDEFEVAYLSYVMVSGAVFALLNLFVILKFVIETFKQVKFTFQINSFDRKFIEIQQVNMLFVITMLLSSIHFPVITNYMGTLIFVFHLAFGLYILEKNRDQISRL